MYFSIWMNTVDYYVWDSCMMFHGNFSRSTSRPRSGKRKEDVDPLTQVIVNDAVDYVDEEDGGYCQYLFLEETPHISTVE